MAEFFAPRADGRGGLALFVNAGDPPLAALPDVLHALDEAGLDALELAVPFPDSVTDGPIIRRSARRALAGGVGLDETLALVAAERPHLRHLRIALFADWSHTVRLHPLTDVVTRVRDAGADGLLVHALPPRCRGAFQEAAAATGMPLVTTCYPDSPPDMVAEAAARAGAYLYLVAHRGRSGSAPPGGHDGLAATLDDLRAATAAPIALGFGIRDATDVARAHRLGADAAIVGTAGVARIESAAGDGRDVAADLGAFVRALRPSLMSRQSPASGAAP
jgi:tryptophan synthase alpha chain